MKSSASMPMRETPKRLVTVWPHLLYPELIYAIVWIAILIVASLVWNAPLEEPANPTHTPNPAKAPWYFVGLQELLVYFDPWMAGVVIPLVIIYGLCAMPYIDPSRRGGGVYSFRERRRAFIIFTAGLAGWFILIAIGSWFRGPGWAWVWPWKETLGSAPVEVSTSLPNTVGIPLLTLYFIGLGAWIVHRTGRWERFTPGRRWNFALLTLAMTGVGLKIVMRLVFGIKYVVSFPSIGFNI